VDLGARRAALRDRRAGGRGKIPLLPEYVESISDDCGGVRNYAGKRYVYRQPGAAERQPPTEFEPVLVGRLSHFHPPCRKNTLTEPTDARHIC